jgi:hypothetical protein
LWYDSATARKEIKVAETKEFDWSGVNGQAVERLRAPKIPDVPKEIVAMAQRAYDGVKDPKSGEMFHVLSHRFGSDEQAAAFAKHVKNAGHHTTPLSTVTAVIDPMNTGDNRLVHWQGGKRRGRGTTV